MFTHSCSHCDEEFNSRESIRKFCSRECSINAIKRPIIQCIICQQSTNNPKFCSSSCSATYNNCNLVKRSKDTRWICSVCGISNSWRKDRCWDCAGGIRKEKIFERAADPQKENSQRANSRIILSKIIPFSKCITCDQDFLCDSHTRSNRRNCYHCVPRGERYAIVNCVICSKQFRGIKYCSTICAKVGRSRLRFNWPGNPRADVAFEDLKTKDRRKAYLINERGWACEKCLNSQWNGKPITIEMHHIDGDNDNNLKTNLELLCPNCHSQTENWRGKKSK